MTIWRKSSYTGSGNDEVCVEVASLSGGIGVRDSKHRERGRLELRRDAFAGLLEHLKTRG
ncbi:DUF397 domain-containing protein [Actinocorallia longicatena]|uniref:DUF397 domain-containing protein n=1 Tax=Actinocorallia longicatena TaxID=111803 RepID=A0ABP6QMQ2_9ACTN